MGCNCGQKFEQLELEFEVDPNDADTLLEAAYSAIIKAMNAAYDVGVQNGARGALATSELASVAEEATQDDELANLVEADAVVLDSVSLAMQDIVARLEAIEMQLGLKYVG